MPTLTLPTLSIDQVDIEKWFRTVHGTERWTRIESVVPMAKSGVGLSSQLIPVELVLEELGTAGWDQLAGPGFSVLYDDGAKVVTYHRSTGERGEVSIAIFRTFSHSHQSHFEIAEEFRLLFNLYEDHSSRTYFEVKDDGTEAEVIRLADAFVDVRTITLRRYQAARQLALVLLIDSTVWDHVPKGKADYDLPTGRTVSTDLERLEVYSGGLEFGRPFSRLLGKKIVLPPPLEESGLWPFEQEKVFLDFIIGEDDKSNPILHNCDPGNLANNFGANPEAPHYLTPVYFDREVLRKYYENSDRYEVDDGGLKREGLWFLRIDNNPTDYVSVFLGDLGRDIPTVEQQHWRAYNILPEDRSLSETAFLRSFMGEFAEPSLPEHLLKQAYERVREAWEVTFGWPLFKDLHPDDQHVFGSLRLLISNSTSELDAQILNLAKLLVDSINEEQISAVLGEKVKNERGIGKLDRYLQSMNYPHLERDLNLLRTVQGIRSRAAAHRRGSDFDLAKAGLDPVHLREGFRQLLEGLAIMLQGLTEFAHQWKPALGK